MPEKNRVYIDTCPFIDMAKFKAKLQLAPTPDARKDRESDVWTMTKLLEASRDGEVQILTSMLTITECLFLGSEPDKIPDADTQRFFSELLLSGKSGVATASPSLAIMEEARDLRWRKKIVLKPMDSLHVATAIHHHCKEILTHDRDLLSDSVRLPLEGMGLRVSYPRKTSYLPTKYAQQEMQEGR